ncbi:hypothetical protein HPP92_005629 [Vanilla planifolia]|uniref:ATPase AAA-type core domain-containing protein n=1 Tax=Vanilla planifolia TaxID=51239 RepID=A0A835RHH8_VANPL|nr:hypothetical protein HPP92_005629 [Vanilla planifolia]
MRELFKVFIDELDALLHHKKEWREELSLRMVATLLNLMDEIKRFDRIIVIVATNRPDSIDPALETDLVDWIEKSKEVILELPKVRWEDIGGQTKETID